MTSNKLNILPVYDPERGCPKCGMHNSWDYRLGHSAMLRTCCECGQEWREARKAKVRRDSSGSG